MNPASQTDSALPDDPGIEPQGRQWLAPATFAIVFLGALSALLAFLWQQHTKESREELDGMARAGRDAIALRLDNARKSLTLMAENYSDGILDSQAFNQVVAQYALEQPGVARIEFRRPNLDIEWTHPGGADSTLKEGRKSLGRDFEFTAGRALRDRIPRYTHPFDDPEGETRIALLIPTYRDATPVGLLSVYYSCPRALTEIVPAQLKKKYRVSLLGPGDRLLSRLPLAGSQQVDSVLTMSVPLEEFGTDVSLLIERYKSAFTSWGVFLLGLICVMLVLGMDYSVYALRRHVGRRQKAEAALRRQTDLYETLLQAQSDLGEGFILMRGNRVMYANSAACRIVGFSFEELKSMDSALGLLAPQAREAAERRMAQRQQGKGREERYETTILHASGTPVELDILARPIELDDGICHVFIVRDITPRKRAEEEQRAMEAQVQRAQRLESLGLFAGGIAHDFNNLLTAVLANADLALLDLPDDSPARPYIDLVQQASWRAADLTNQVLAYAGGGQASDRAVDLTAEVRDIRDLLASITSKKAALVLDLSENLPSVRADATQIRQIIMNLIANASESLPNGVGAISVRTGCKSVAKGDPPPSGAEATLDEGEYVFLEVADTGCGMEPSVRERIFEPFFSTKFTGRGLGLAAVMGIVRRHLGVITVESQPGRGTLMRVVFPAAAAQAEVPEPPSEDTSTGLDCVGSILVVDDEEAVRDVARRILERAGMQAIAAADGAEAVDIYRKESGAIDAILLDLTMPRMNGDEAFEEIIKIRPDARVILSSGFTEQEAGKRFPGRRPLAFIQKPYHPFRLVEKIRLALSPDAMEAAVASSRMEGQPEARNAG